jgi:hypothetical protein
MNFDSNLLTLEDLQRLNEILPTDSEKKSLLAMKTADMHNSERFLFELSSVDNIQKKV